ncbi:apolipoprotein D-like [Belonocnema kinseyi]|uniref:apolipoprotein D-like n=1 Tax=Belonocnema kinseyi TaxID=2817044 RepID=UPI00143CD5BE|nr:apolipoprotein D-like [Belonocnema kinseyi]
MIQVGILFLTYTGALAQVIDIGHCPKVTVVDDFDVTKYEGLWYEIKKYYAIFEKDGQCITANYTLNADGTLKVVNSQISSQNGQSSSAQGTAKFVGSKTEGKLSVVFQSTIIQIPGPYWILYTDYDTLAVVYSCVDAFFSHATNVWILARAPKLSDEDLATAYTALEDNNLSKGPLQDTVQTNCKSKA